MKLKELLEGDVVQGNFPKHGKVILSHRRDTGEEWKYWNGVNWLGTKDQAMKVERSKVKALLDKWGLNDQRRTSSGEVRVYNP